MGSLDSASGNPSLVTIGITCFDAENTIKRAVDCARQQDWPNLEIVVVDDASTDNSPAVIREISEVDGRIRYILHKTNKGYAGALNSIIEAADGDFVVFFDDDDESVPDRVSRQFDRLNRYSEATNTDRVFCYTNRHVVLGETGGERTDFVSAIGRKPAEPNGPAVADYLLWHRREPGFVWGQFGSCTLMARTKTIKDAGGFDESFRRGAEWDLAIRLALSGGHFIAVDEPLITQFITLTPDKAGKMPLKSVLRLRQKHKKYLKSKRVYRASIAMAHARYYYAKGNKFLSRFYLALACICSPFKVLPSEIANWKQK
jgi:glycosyltransferase involved in cell wall biosynthesis